MNEAKVTALRSIELGVPDLARSRKFYVEAWGLEEVRSEGDTAYLRGTGPEHHVLSLRRSPQPALLGVHLAADDRGAVDRLHAKAKAFGADVLSAPAPLPGGAGGGYGFALRTPEGLPLHISSDVARCSSVISDRSRPAKITHVVLNTARMDKQMAFFRDLLGFRLSDSTRRMEFLRCGPDHHSVALAHSDGHSLNHVAYEMQNIDGLMRGCGRLAQRDLKAEWGVGRHGPGNNVFAYFIDPSGLVAEYTTEVDQIDEAEYLPASAEYWENFPMRPCRWGMAREPSARLRLAMSGKATAGEAQRAR